MPGAARAEAPNSFGPHLFAFAMRAAGSGARCARPIAPAAHLRLPSRCFSRWFCAYRWMEVRRATAPDRDWLVELRLECTRLGSLIWNRHSAPRLGENSRRYLTAAVENPGTKKQGWGEWGVAQGPGWDVE